jgi:phage anti-repressor protein
MRVLRRKTWKINGIVTPSSVALLVKRHTRPMVQRNKRDTIFVNYNGTRRTLAKVCEERGIALSVVHCRLGYGWTLDDALSRPVAARSRRRADADHQRAGPAPRALGVGRDFSNWIKDRIERGQFQQDIDFIEELDSPNPGSQVGHGGRRHAIEYHLSLDMAKHLALMENNPRGHAYRQWLIDVARVWSLVPQIRGINPGAAETVNRSSPTSRSTWRSTLR